MDAMERASADGDMPVSVRLTRTELARMDDVARRLGYSRSHLMRKILRRGLEGAHLFAPRDASADVADPDAPRAPP